MNRPHLVVCRTCQRHVRVDEAACPFCAGVLGDAFRATPAPRRVTARLSRAALFALGTSGLAATATFGCSDDKDAVFDANCCPDAYGGPPPPFDARRTLPLVDSGDSAADDAADAVVDAPSDG